MTPRRWRLLAAGVVLCLFAASYLLPEATARPIRRSVLPLQVSTTLTSVSMSLLLAAVVIALTILLGRWYCSVACPAGLVQELFHRLGGLLRTRRLRYFPTPLPRLRLIAVALASLAGVVALANFLDPIGVFGRVALPVGEAFRAVVTGRGDVYSYDTVTWLIMAVGGILLVVVPLFKGRWFCDVLCPVGALLGLFPTRHAGVVLDREKCVSCGQCEKLCPTRCQDAAKKRMDESRCVVCLDCVDACRFGALSYGRKPVAAEERRGFIVSSVSAAAGALFVVSRPLAGGLKVMPTELPDAIYPPGSVSPERHRARCVSCQSCVLACPVGIIRPVAPDMRPVLDYDYGYCQYACVECNHACPAGVFDPLTVEEKQGVRLARTTLHLDRCVVVTQGTECGACAEVCPTHAVRMASQGEGLPTLPDFDAAYCIGCGACYHVCPAEPRAFQVIGVERQTVSSGVRPGGHAEETKPEETDSGDLTDFPF